MNDDYETANKNVGVHINTFQMNVKEITIYTLFQIESFFYCTVSSTSTMSSGGPSGINMSS
jgi:hypothetical protein